MSENHFLDLDIVIWLYYDLINVQISQTSHIEMTIQHRKKRKKERDADNSWSFVTLCSNSNNTLAVVFHTGLMNFFFSAMAFVLCAP